MRDDEEYLNELIRFCIGWEKMVQTIEQPKKQTVKRQLSETAKVWLADEPSYPKSIVRQIHGRLPDKLPV